MRPEMVAIVAIHEAIEAACWRRIEDVEDGAAPHLPDPALISMHCSFCQQQLTNYLYLLFIRIPISVPASMWALELG